MENKNRFDRVTATLIQLQARKTTTAQDLAERFGVSLRTVYRDIRSLEAAGVPIYGEAGLGYSLVEGYRLPPVMFTQAEAASLITAEKLVEKLMGSQIRADYRSALYKIKAVLRTHDKDFLEGLEERIVVRKPTAPAPGPDRPDCFPVILRSLAEKKVLNLDYRTPDRPGPSRRKIEPVGVFFDRANWHLIAYCRMRKDYRNFRLDRIASLDLLGETFPNRHPSLREFLERVNRERNLEPVALWVSLRAAGFLEEAKYYWGFVHQTRQEDGLEMHFLAASLDDFSHWFVNFAEHARILRPQALRDKVKSLLERKSADF